MSPEDLKILAKWTVILSIKDSMEETMIDYALSGSITFRDVELFFNEVEIEEQRIKGCNDERKNNQSSA